MMEDEIRSKAQQQLLIKLKVPKLERGEEEDDEEEEEEEEEDEELEEGEIKEDYHHDDVVAAAGGGRSSSELIEQQPIDHHNFSTKSSNKKAPLQAEAAAAENITYGGGAAAAAIRICPECFKEFSSGKALDGHMRIHAQQHPQQKKCSNNNNKLIKSSDHHVQKKTIHNHHTTKGHDQKHRHQKSSYYTSCHDDNGRPFCNLCGKNFPSLKSLFGHMRCHPEREWRGILPPSVPVKVHQQHKNYDQNNNHNHKAASRLPSSSSLSYDDSRSRSDKNEEDCDQYGYDSVDLRGRAVGSTGSLLRWAVRAKRGRKVSASTPEISAGSEWEKEEEEEEDEEEIRDAVEDLMRLAQGDHQSIDESGLTHKQRVDEFEATNSNSLTDKAGGLDGNSAGSKERNFDHAIRNMDHKEKGKEKVGMEMIPQKPLKLEYGHKKNLSDHEYEDGDGSDSNEQPLINIKYNSSNANCVSTNGSTVVIKNNNISVSSSTPCTRKRKKMKLMMDLESDHHLDFSPTSSLAQAHDKTLVVSPDKYKCSTCNKSFPTHQALGGHRSSHNKFKITVLNAVDQDGDGDHIKQPTVNQQLAAVDENIVKEIETVLAAHSGSTHQCKICNKIFPTGHALGGHKRCHWTGPAEQGQSIQVTSPGEASQTQITGSQKVHNFDLNEPPPMEDEAPGYGHLYQAPSSSNNSNIG